MMKTITAIGSFLVGLILFGLIILIAQAIFHAGLCHAAEWDTTDKALFSGFVALQVVDTLQTNEIRKHQDKFRETNSLYGNPPSMGRVVAVKSLFVGGTYWLVKDADPTIRKWTLGALDVLYVGVVAHNYQVGVRIGF